MKNIVFFLVFLLLLFSGTQACSRTERAGLLKFQSFFSINKFASFDPWVDVGCEAHLKTESWKKNRDCCAWEGVTCDEGEGHVIGLDLWCSGLQGSLPSSDTGLLLLPHLQNLNLSFNDFNDSQIPSDVTRLVGLKKLSLAYAGFAAEVGPDFARLSSLFLLDLSGSGFTITTKAFDTSLRNMSRLRQLLLEDTDMTGVSLSSLSNLSASLSVLSLSLADLQGYLPNHTFQHLANLESLYLDRNPSMSGFFPSLNWSSPLRHLDLFATNLTGKVPEWLGNFRFLESLDLNRCSFFGPFPASLGNLTRLKSLELLGNHFNGEIPSSFANLPGLNRFRLLGSSLGSIPTWLGNLTEVTDLVLSGGLTGQLPASLSNLKQLSHLDLSDNKLEGPIPSSFGDLQRLTELWLYNNSLNGTLPYTIFSLPFLQDLRLYDNHLTGRIYEFLSKSVEIIDLSNNKFYGQIPSSIFQLVNLKQLFFTSNNLSGPVELSLITELKNLSHFHLSHNPLLSLSTKAFPKSSSSGLYGLGLASCNLGEFPDILRYLPQVSLLDLSDNKISGGIPPWFWHVGEDSLTHLNLSHNLITGFEQLPWRNLEFLDIHSNLIGASPPLSSSFSNTYQKSSLPRSICNLTSLKFLDLSNNSFSGTIPECLLYSSQTLFALVLRKNNFRGTIPDKFVNGSVLVTINLHDNKLEGPLPRSLAYCTQLQVLDVGRNKVKDTFPDWLSRLPNLQVLVLHSNQFHGPIPISGRRYIFSKLRILDVSYNNFTGAISAGLLKNFKAMVAVSREEKGQLQYMGNYYYKDSVMITLKGMEVELVRILKIFTTIDLSSNNIEGGIPRSIGDLQALIVLNISHNRLHGSIPSSLANLGGLESLDISSNLLVGEIPPQMISLTFLSWLNLSHNRLVGPIPVGNQFNTFQNDSYSGNLGLCGEPLSKKCNTSVAGEPPEAEEDSFAEGFTWQVVLMGFGCGLVVGMVTGSLMLWKRKPLWLATMVEGECRRIQGMRYRRRRGRRAARASK